MASERYGLRSGFGPLMCLTVAAVCCVSYSLGGTGNSVVMNDGFEYTVANYGIGTLESSQDEPNERTVPEVFWIEFRIKNTNKERRVPRYLQGFELLVDQA